jgi:hypothetical protein
MKKENGRQEQKLCSRDEKGKWKIWKRRKQNSVQVMKKRNRKHENGSKNSVQVVKKKGNGKHGNGGKDSVQVMKTGDGKI